MGTDPWTQFDIVLKLIEILVLPILFGIYRALGKIGETLVKISEDLAMLKEWRDQHMELDSERFKAHHERLQRLEHHWDGVGH